MRRFTEVARLATACALVIGSATAAFADGAAIGGAAAGEATISASSPLHIGFGARVGGYGFRQLHSEGGAIWTDCRMDGIGVFGEMGLGKVLFGEVGLDLYSANTETAREEGMDRVSTLVSAAIGARMFPKALVSPYVQVGIGGEVTQFQMGDGPQDVSLLPMGFVGFGGDLKLGRHLRIGANFRMNMMGHFEHAHSDYVEVTTAAHTHDVSDMPVDFEPAAQAQFFLRYDL